MPGLGTRRLLHVLKDEIKKHSIKVGRDKLFELLGFYGLLLTRRKRSVRTTNSHHWLKKYPNLVDGRVLTRAEQLWVSDMTYMKVADGFCYLSLITDAYSRKIVGYALHPSLEKEGPLRALKMAIEGRMHRGKEQVLIHHSDRGIQYCSDDYVNMLQSEDIAISMTETGSPYDNALAERMNSTIKNEFCEGKIFSNYLQAQRAVDRSILTYNDERPHLSLGYATPSEAHMMQGAIDRGWKNYKRKKQKEVIMGEA